MFKCNECENPFRSKDALKKHQTVKRHGNNKSHPVNQEPSRYQRRSGARGTMTAVGWKSNPNTGQMMNMQLDENWALCDKECGWCGHCADNILF
jgi:hypothetical protein